ncbi:MAG TPA: transmembrane 220 family protein [Chitinophagaceae bacterium]
MKIFNLAFCIFFILFAALQYNDVDFYVWIPVYMYGAVLCWLAFRNKFYPKLYLVGIVVYAIYALYKVFDENGVRDWIIKHQAEDITGSMKATQPWIEETREFFGLAILIIVLLIDFFYAKKRNRLKLT